VRIIRTKEQIEALIAKLKEEADALPSHNLFGDSNAEDLDEMREWVDDLRLYLETGKVRDVWNEAGHWLTSTSGTLGNDYGVE
jgi:hypothetical protein